MDTAPWLQDVGMVKQPPNPLEISSAANARPQQGPPLLEKRARPQKEQALNCPRCNSTNTKFCYYNNYSLTQPRYFCKTCRRYWTEGGSLRNVPVGGGSRKNKRSSSTASSSAAPSKKLQQDANPIENPNKYMEAHDLNLSFPHHAGSFMKGGGVPSAIDLSGATDGLSAMELLRGGRGMGASFMAMAMQEASPGVYPHGGFVLQDFRSNPVSFPVDVMGGNGGGYENMQEVDGASGGRALFPFEDLSQVPSNPTAAAAAASSNNPTGFDHRQGDSSGFWNGVIGSGGATW